MSFAELPLDNAIGIELHRPLNQSLGLAATLSRYLGELSEKVGLGGRNLEAAPNDIDSQDENNQRVLIPLSARLKRISQRMTED